MITQKEFTLGNKSRGFHLITSDVLQYLDKLPETGLLNLFIKHTSAALTLNENADPSVRYDFEQIMNHVVTEDEPYYTHTFEGSDDMPAHVKASLIGPSITIPIKNHRLNLGTWQGIYLCEFRNYGGARRLVATVYA